MGKQFTIEKLNDILIINLRADEISLQEIEDFKTQARNYIDRGYNNIAINLKSLSDVSSVILAALVYITQKARLRQGDVKLFNLQEGVHKVFRLMLLDRLFEIYNNQREALAGFKKI